MYTITMNAPYVRFVIFPLFVITVFLGAHSNARGAETDLSLKISAEKTIVAPGEDIVLRAVLTNTSDAEVPFGYSADPNFDLDVQATMPTGQPAPQSRIARRLHDVSHPMSPTAWITGSIPPGESVSWQLYVEDFVDVTAPGTYTLQARFPAKSPTPVLSNVVVVTVDRTPLGAGPTAAEVLRAAGVLFPRRTNSPLVLTIDAGSTFSAGQGITFRYELVNISSQTITFSPGGMHQYAAEVRDETGKPVADREANRLRKERLKNLESDRDIRPAQPPVRIDPGDQASGPIFLDRLVDVSKPGIYTVQLWKRIPAEAGGGEVRSNVIAITIK